MSWNSSSRITRQENCHAEVTPACASQSECLAHSLGWIEVAPCGWLCILVASSERDCYKIDLFVSSLTPGTMRIAKPESRFYRKRAGVGTGRFPLQQHCEPAFRFKLDSLNSYAYPTDPGTEHRGSVVAHSSITPHRLRTRTCSQRSK